MGHSLSTVEFALRPGEWGHELLITIDGAELLDLVHSFEQESGVDPRTADYGWLSVGHFPWHQWPNHFLGEDWAPGRLLLLGCGGCGEWGCWPFWAKVTAADRVVTWDAFTQPFRPERDYSGLGAFSFDEPTYRSSLEALQAEITAADPTRGRTPE